MELARRQKQELGPELNQKDHQGELVQGHRINLRGQELEYQMQVQGWEQTNRQELEQV
jgi:hypothetical protein